MAFLTEEKQRKKFRQKSYIYVRKTMYARSSEFVEELLFKAGIEPTEARVEHVIQGATDSVRNVQH